MKKIFLLIIVPLLFLISSCDTYERNVCVDSENFSFSRIEKQRTLLDTDIETFGTTEIYVLVVENGYIELSDTVYANAQDEMYSSICYNQEKVSKEFVLTYDYASFSELKVIEMLTFEEGMEIYDACMDLVDSNIAVLFTCNLNSAEQIERYNRNVDDDSLKITYENWEIWKSSE